MCGRSCMSVLVYRAELSSTLRLRGVCARYLRTRVRHVTTPTWTWLGDTYMAMALASAKHTCRRRLEIICARLFVHRHVYMYVNMHDEHKIHDALVCARGESQCRETLHVYVHMNVCMYINESCKCLLMHTSSYPFVYIYIYIYIYTYIHTYIHMRVCLFFSVRMAVPNWLSRVKRLVKEPCFVLKQPCLCSKGHGYAKTVMPVLKQSCLC
jgi:hypothetical protein